MSELPKKFWSRPWTGFRGWLLWFILWTAVAFVCAFGIAYVSEPGSLGHILALVFPVSLAVGLGLTIIVKFVGWVCNWRNFRRFLFGVACFITLIALAYAVENWRGKHAWEKHVREWEAKGEKFRITEIAPAPVPDDKNFALTPLLKPALDYVHGPQGIVRRDTNGYARLESLNASLRMEHRTNELVLGKIDLGTLADLEACRTFYQGNTNYPQPLKPGSAAEDILLALSKFDPEMKELREAAATRPYCRFPVEYEFKPAFDLLLPHLALMKGICQVTGLRAIARLELGQSDAAMEELKLGIRLADSVKSEPVLISHLVWIAALSLNLNVVCEGLARHAWSDAQLVELEKYLATIDVLAEYKIAMRGERSCNTAGLDYFRRGGFRSTPSEYRPMPSGWFYQNMVTISQMHQKYTIAAVDEQTHRVFTQISTNYDREIEDLRGGPYTIFAQLLMPALSKAAHRSARAQVNVDAARLACAAERYRLVNGKFPDTLEVLVPQFIPKIPNDVMDGRPLRYRKKTDARMIVYSIGWNMKDDGGELGWKSDRQTVLDLNQGDWLWWFPAK